MAPYTYLVIAVTAVSHVVLLKTVPAFASATPLAQGTIDVALAAVCYLGGIWILGRDANDFS